jgi:hypothetical protein
MSKDKYLTIDKFDRLFGELSGLPDVSTVKESTVMTHSPLVAMAQTFVIKTIRQRNEGDTIFVQYIDAEGGQRFVIPPAASEAIARQREALTLKSRRQRGHIGGKAAQDARRARGEPHPFSKGQNRAPRKKKKRATGTTPE